MGKELSSIIYLIFYLTGFYCAENKESFWNSIEKYKKHIIANASISSVILLGIVSSNLPGNILIGIESLYSWSWCLLAFMWAKTFHSKYNKLIQYLSHTIYCMYITHIPIILIGTYLLNKTNLSIIESISCLIISTILISILIYEGFRKLTPINILLGIKKKVEKARKNTILAFQNKKNMVF